MQKQTCQYEERLLRERKYFLVFSVLSVLAPILSLIPALRPGEEALGTWFQRSGSLMVVLALLAEMRAYQMFDVFKPSGYVNLSYNDTKKRYSKQVTACNIVAFFLIAIGTIIWGYGDLLIERS